MLWLNCKIKGTDLLLLPCRVRRDSLTHQVYHPCLPFTWSHTRNITSLIFHIYTHTQAHFVTFTGNKQICSRTNIKLTVLLLVILGSILICTKQSV